MKTKQTILLATLLKSLNVNRVTTNKITDFVGLDKDFVESARSTGNWERLRAGYGSVWACPYI